MSSTSDIWSDITHDFPMGSGSSDISYSQEEHTPLNMTYRITVTCPGSLVTISALEFRYERRLQFT